jgi:hypothetical protein
MSTVTAPAKILTPDDVLDLSDGDRYELVDGRLVELDATALPQLINTRLSWMLMNYC